MGFSLDINRASSFIIIRRMLVRGRIAVSVITITYETGLVYEQ